jgi:hypothetical protein
MLKKVIGFVVVLISFVMVAPLSARGPGNGSNQQFTGTLTEPEIEHITYMREEEKLARDVYLTLYERYPEALFFNIGKSEQRHMDAMEKLIVNYGLEDPAVDDTVGVFSNETFTKLYTELVGAGTASYCAALQAGIDIENLDIDDIEETVLPDAVAPDVIRVMNNLLRGSYNHLNAFTSQFSVNECDQ